jgi:hypothetical protein
MRKLTISKNFAIEDNTEPICIESKQEVTSTVLTIDVSSGMQSVLAADIAFLPFLVTCEPKIHFQPAKIFRELICTEY